MTRSLFFLACMYIGALSLVAAEEEFDVCATTTNGPDDLTNLYGKPIERTCILVEPETPSEEERCFYTYVPESCSEKEITNAPLVVDVHGVSSCAAALAGYSGWMKKADEECIVIVWPIGQPFFLQGGCWNVPGFLMSSEIESTEGSNNEISTAPCCCLDSNMLPETDSVDPQFIRDAIDQVVDSFALTPDLKIDTDRIYMAGHSNGCIMSLAMAALYSDTIAAVCCHAGALQTPFAEDYTPVPVWMIHGTDDQTIPYAGATLLTFPGIGAVGFLSVDQAMSYLVDQNGCSEEEDVDLKDETGVVIGKVSKRSNCKGNADVEIVTLNGGDHYIYKDIPQIGTYDTTVDTTAMAWEFCSSHSKGSQEPVVPETSPPKESEPEVQADTAVEVEIDVESEKKDDEESSAPTQKSFSVVLVLALFFGVVGTV